jgi:hypothetical protein
MADIGMDGSWVFAGKKKAELEEGVLGTGRGKVSRTLPGQNTPDAGVRLGFIQRS